MIRLEAVALRYDGAEVLSGLSFTVPEGGFRWLLGPSGAGKSSLLRLLHLTVRPTRGRLTLIGTDIGAAPRQHLPHLRRLIGMVFQDFRLLGHLSVFDNVALPLRIAGAKPARIRSDVTELLRWVGLAGRAGALPSVLSGGEQQRVAIARALANDPVVLIADEPTGNLDERATRGIFQLLRDINANGTAVIMATHDLELIRRAECRTIEMNHGAIVFDSADQASTHLAPGADSP
jgi:cell division transport system ATP-binding protein